MKTRTEKDSLGTIQVPEDALYGAQTQRAVENFTIGNHKLQNVFFDAMVALKGAAAIANHEFKLLDTSRCEAIVAAVQLIQSGDFYQHFPVGVFQTGSGTSTHMSVNEVLANLASQQSDVTVHPNDHVNMGQSSNDVFPSCIHISCALEIHQQLLPNLENLIEAIKGNEIQHAEIVKTGRTHLMDAMPLTAAQELSGWAQQLVYARSRLQDTLKRIYELAIGGTAVGTGTNTHPRFSQRVTQQLAKTYELPFKPKESFFEALSAQDSALELSGQLKVLAVSLLKICNDLRWMNSGPFSGLSEIQLKALQPGSSIMPGKVNPVIPEAVAMACAQVIGHDASITVAGQSGNFQLNVMLPMIAYNLLDSIQLLSNSLASLSNQVFSDLHYNESHLNQNLHRNPILATALNQKIGYEKSAEIVKESLERGETIIEVALRKTDFTREELEALLDPKRLT